MYAKAPYLAFDKQPYIVYIGVVTKKVDAYNGRIPRFSGLAGRGCCYSGAGDCFILPIID
jgi:hypothetical protein